MKVRPMSVLLSLVLVGAVAGSALSENKAVKTPAKKMDVKSDLKLVEQAETECKEVQTLIDSMTTTCDSCGKSSDPKVLKGAVDKMAKELKKIKKDEEAMLKQLKSLELDFQAPIGY